MNPVTRQEMFLNAAAGNEQALPDPVTREEVFLKAIVDAQSSGGGGGGSSGGGVLVATADGTTMTLDKTWQEINDADFAVIKAGGGTALVMSTSYTEMYYVDAMASMGNSPGIIHFRCDSASGYPVFYTPGDSGNEA